ncbi:hypothetical protein ACS0TY_021882 [Phlomoides rotata]
MQSLGTMGFVYLKIMVVDPVEETVSDDEESDDGVNGPSQSNYIDVVQTSPEWTAWRDNLAITMYNDLIN